MESLTSCAAEELDQLRCLKAFAFGELLSLLVQRKNQRKHLPRSERQSRFIAEGIFRLAIHGSVEKRALGAIPIASVVIECADPELIDQ
ncbi:MAG: hypothetical protein WKF61_10330 [Luteimonas sp.]